MSIFTVAVQLQSRGIRCEVVAADSDTKYQYQWLQLLATTEDAQQHAQNAHWNVRGSDFMPMHKYFEDVISYWQSTQDGVAEMLKSLDIDYRIPNSPAKLRTYSLIHEVGDEEPNVTNPRVHLKKLLKIINILRKHISLMNEVAEQRKHIGGLNYLGELAQELDKRRWFTRAFLKQ